MKNIFIILIITACFTQTTFAERKTAQETSTLSLKERADRSSLSIRFANYSTESASQLQNTVMTDIESFSKLSLSEKNDFELVKNTLKTILILDEIDPSRTAVQLIAESYSKNQKLFKKAIKEIRTDKNKKSLKEIETMMDDFSSDGNG